MAQWCANRFYLNDEESLPMSVQHASENSSLTGLARRWLKTQLQFHGNPQRAHRDRQEADALQFEMRERVHDEVGRALFNTVVPAEWKRKLNGLEEQRIEQGRLRAERRRAEHLALPRADVTLVLRGALRGTISGEIPARFEWPDDGGAFVTLELEPAMSMDVDGRPFGGIRMALPVREARSGAPINLTRAAEQFASDWDPLDTHLWFADSEDAFYWSEEYGSAHFWPAPGLETLQFLMPVQNAAGERVSIEGSVTLIKQATH
jgi:hypothetical protein